ncbi:FAD binding domain-containing protein [Crepidotus variabilis]|uniref:FAD binding domain-containing protein n=1 Tax=Crepidotus variabilis TaxID=179855 RepID=A0A9P6JLM4_9AGAR|nr:FAD binding domain-containing protein [Crepidotus variabilis]
MPISSSLANGSSAKPEVLIVGTGTTGLYLALALKSSGITPRIIDKLTRPAYGHKGSALWPRTLEIIESFGFIDHVLEKAMFPYPVCRYKTGTMEPASPNFNMFPKQESPDCVFKEPRFLGQNVHQTLVISSVFSQRGLMVERGVELIALEQFEDHVAVKLRHIAEGTIEETRFKYIVGCDGAKGLVRKYIGLDFIGESRLQRFAVGDLRLSPKSTFPHDTWHVWGSMGDVSLILRPSDTSREFALQVGGAHFAKYPEIFESLQSLRKFLAKMTGTNIFDEAEFPFMGPYNVNIRMTKTFSQGRVFLAGDACHLHTPSGGQGLNTGIQDSYNLGWKLALAVKGLAHPALLTSYEAERIPVVSAMLQLTTSVWNLGTQNSTADAMADVQNHQEFHQLGVNYRGSEWVIDDEIDRDKDAKDVSPYGGDVKGRIYAGDRAPNVSGLREFKDSEEIIRMFKLFDAGHHTVLVFADGLEVPSFDSMFHKLTSDIVRFVVIYQAGVFTKGINHRKGWTLVEDVEGSAHQSYQITSDGPKLFVIRPDGYIGARVHTAERVEEYFKVIIHM